MNSNKKNIIPRTAVFAGGCFWCTEAIFKQLDGVLEVIPGYTGGYVKNPTYEQVVTGKTGHAEAVMIIYDSEKIGYDKLLEVFFATHDPTQLNRQGNDVGTQYRSAVFYTTPAQKETVEAYIDFLEKNRVFDRPVVTQIEPASEFWPAEDYHKNYLANHPENPYCQFVIIPKLEKFREMFGNWVKKDAF